MGESLSWSLGRFWPLVWTSILAGLLIMLGFICLIIPGIYLMLAFYFVNHAVVLDRVSGGKALGRSRMLMKGQFGKAFVLGFLLALIGSGVTFVTELMPGMVLQSIVGAITQSILFLVSAAVLVVFYFSSRCKNENFDLQVLSESIGR